MRTSALVFLALPTLLLACDPNQNLGGNDTTSRGGGSTGSSTSGGPGGGGAASSSSAGGSGTGGATATTGTGGSNIPVACPPAVKSGTLAAVPFASGALGYAWDLGFGQSHHYLLEGPWVDYTALDGQGMTGSITLPLNEGYHALQILPGAVTIPAAFQTADKLSAVHVSATDETILALKTKQSGSLSAQALPGLAVDGTDVYWSLQIPARVVEAPLGGGNELVLADYDAASGLVPLALAIDSTHVYWTTAKPTSSGEFEGGQSNNRLYRIPRHAVGAVAELVASSYNAMNAIVLEGSNVHLGFTRGTSVEGNAGGTVSKSGGEIVTWGLDTTSCRISRMALLDGYVYYTEQRGNACDGRLLRYPLAEISKGGFFRHGELLVDGMMLPSNLVAHDGKLYFTTNSDPSASQSEGGVFSLVPPATSTCMTCGEVYSGGATSSVCGSSEQKFLSLVICGQQNGCGQFCALPASGQLSASCKSCMEQHCPSEESVCAADNGG